MKVYILWCEPKNNYDKEPQQIWEIYKTKEIAEKEKKHIKRVSIMEHGYEQYKLDIEECEVKEKTSE